MKSFTHILEPLDHNPVPYNSKLTSTLIKSSNVNRLDYLASVL